MLEHKTRFGLSRLLAPIDTATFEHEYWERRTLLIRRADPLYYKELFSLDAADLMISTASRKSPNIRIVKDGEERTLEGSIPPDHACLYTEHVLSAYRTGSTVVLPFVHERWPPLQDLCAALSADCSTGFQVNAYLTPPGEQGLGVHYDTHDVFVLQVEGVKHWRLFGSPMPLPLPSQPYREGAVPEPVETEVFGLNAGDLLYLPRGFMHEAISKHEPSLHLTVGVLPITWAEVICAAVESTVADDVTFRRSLPLGFAKDGSPCQDLEERVQHLLGVLARQTSCKTAVENARARAQLAIRPTLRGHLRDLKSETNVTVDTAVMKRERLQWSLSRDDGEMCLSFHGKRLSMPGYVEADLRFMVAATGPFAGSSLPGPLDQHGRVTLVRRLLREGFLTLAATPAPPVGSE